MADCAGSEGGTIKTLVINGCMAGNSEQAIHKPNAEHVKHT